MDEPETTDRGFVVYTNTLSRKGDELRANPQAAMLFREARLRALATYDDESARAVWREARLGAD